MPPNPQMQPTGRLVPSSARALTADGGQWNEGLCGRVDDRLQLICTSLGVPPLGIYDDSTGEHRSRNGGPRAAAPITQSHLACLACRCSGDVGCPDSFQFSAPGARLGLSLGGSLHRPQCRRNELSLSPVREPVPHSMGHRKYLGAAVPALWVRVEARGGRLTSKCSRQAGRSRAPPGHEPPVAISGT